MEGASEKDQKKAAASCLKQRFFLYLSYCYLLVSVAHTLSKWLY